MGGAVLVTGGLGYVGRHLVAALAERGERVISYNRDYAEGSPTGVEFVQGELYDIPRLVDTFSRHEVDRVIHTAAMSHPDLSVDLPITTFTANVDGTLHLFEAARMAGVKRVVNFSSECAYGHVDGPVTEDFAPASDDPLRRDEGDDGVVERRLQRPLRARHRVAPRDGGLRAGEQDAGDPPRHHPSRRWRASRS